PGPKPRFSLDLHVLSAPPAFVLSQDQTLREESLSAGRSRFDSLFTSSLSSKVASEGRDGFQPRPDRRSKPAEVSTFARCSVFKDRPPSDLAKKPPDRTRGPSSSAKRRIRLARWVSYVDGRLLGAAPREAAWQ